MPDSAQEVALLLEALDDMAGGRVPGYKEDGVQNLGGTGELVALGLVDSAIGANAEAVGLTLDELNTAVAETTLNAQLLSHKCTEAHSGWSGGPRGPSSVFSAGRSYLRNYVRSSNARPAGWERGLEDGEGRSEENEEGFWPMMPLRFIYRQQ